MQVSSSAKESKDTCSTRTCVSAGTGQHRMRK